MNHPPQNRLVSILRSRAALIVSVAVVACVAGILLARIFPNLFTGPSAPVSIAAIREKGKYDLISPLLLCGPKDTLRESRALERKIENIISLKKASGELTTSGVYLRELDSGVWAGVNADAEFSPASLLKLPTMIAYFKYAERVPEILSKQVFYQDRLHQNKKEYFKPTDRILPGNSYSIEDLIRAMITHSDNNATVLLDQNVDKNSLLEAYTDLGLPIPFTQEATADFLSPRLYSYFLRLLYNATYLNRDFSERALLILSQSDFNKGLVAGVPSDVRVAHKFGERSVLSPDGKLKYSELHDCGIVYYPTNPYLLCVMTKGKDLDELAGVIKEISAVVYDAVSGEVKP